MRAARSVRLMVILAVFCGAMSIGVASASAFSLSSSTSTTQAAAPTDLRYTYVATGTQALSQLDVELPPGVMHDATAPAVCASVTYETDRCPSFSLAGSVSARLAVLGGSVNVPGSIYRVADNPADGTFEFGIVLRPPFSALGLTRKIYLKGRATIAGNGSMRHSITGDLSSISVFGIPLRSRITRMALTFNGINENGNQLYNSTSCASQPLRATASFSDGSSESRTSPYTTTGCPLVPLTSSAELTLDDPTPGRHTPFAILLDPGDDAERGQLHDSHVKSIGADISGVGSFDTQVFAALPSCPTDLQLSDRCPEGSKVGSLSTSVNGLADKLSGELYRSAESPNEIVGVLDFPEDRIIGFKIEIDGVIQGSKGMVINIPVQLPFGATAVKIDAPILKLHGKPASCSTRESRVILSGHSGGWSLWGDDNYAAEPCPPSVAHIDPLDQDDDGDGFADDEIRPENFEVPLTVADGGNGVDESSASCDLESPEPASAVRGKIRMVRDPGNGNYACVVTGASGPLTVVFSIASLDGHVTVLKMSFTVDGEPPVLESEAPEVMEFDGTNVTLGFTFTDDLIGHPQSDYEVECVIEDQSGNREPPTPGHKYIDTLTLRGNGECMWDTGRSGRFALEASVIDSGGHVTVLKRTAVVDAQGPVITLTDYRDQDSDEDGLPDEALRLSSFDIPFTVGGDDDIDTSSISCKLINPVAMDKDLRVADLDGDGAADVCQVTDAPGGPNTVEISAADHRGHVTVLKMAYTVDTEAPTYETTAPDKVVYDLPTIDYEFEFTDDTLTHPQSEFTAEVELSTGQVSSARIVTDRDSGRSKGFARFESVPDGDHEMTLTLSDSTGHVTVLKISFQVDATGPVIRLINPEGVDNDGDGVFDETRYVRDFDRAMSIEDHSDLDLSSVKCTVRGWDPTTKELVAAEDLDGDGLADVCRFTDAPDGLHELEISAADVHGHVTVLKAAITVDATPPAVTILSPVTGQTFSSGSMMPVRFTADGEAPLEFVCKIDSVVVDPSCSSTDSFSLGGLSAGSHLFSVTASDSRGRSATSSVSFNIASEPPTYCIAIYPPPPGCPGYIPPGDVIIIQP